ncbi:MAG: M20 family metallopeptidase [Candidatus Omnitrophota bacterium]|jgi:succinyl-diaminopimelate desuccinylase
MINKKRLIDLTRQLIKIDSQNPPGNETAIACFLKTYLEKLGLRVKIVAFKKNRPNVIAYLLGKDTHHSLLVTPHLDTVPAGRKWRCDPFAGVVVQNKLYGIGATDCKGNLACAVEAIHSIVENKAGLYYNLVLAATADEESGSTWGLIPLLKKSIIKVDAAVVLDTEEFEIIVAQKGLLHVKVKLEGKRAHGAYPWRGDNAIDAAVRIVAELKSRKMRFRKNRYLLPPTLNVGTIKGGDKVNVVADWCELELDFRFLPGTEAGSLLRMVKDIVKKHSRKFVIEVEGIQKPYCIDQGHPLVKYLTAAMRACKIKPRICGSEGATVITFFQEQSIPAVATGFGSEGCAHISNEYVSLDNLYQGTVVLEKFLTDFKF